MEHNIDISKLRQEYMSKSLNKSDLLPDPFDQFNLWFHEAVKAAEIEPNAMAIATADTTGFPSVRMVLLKGLSQKSFYFYTNYNSQKGKELAANPKASLLFWWQTLERQVRIRGEVVKASPEESDEYFNSRPEGSRMGAICSPQSQVVPNRRFLEEKMENFFLQYMETGQLIRPADWGGFRLIPERMEFWQGRENRFHDRLVYRKEVDTWQIERLAP